MVFQVWRGGRAAEQFDMTCTLLLCTLRLVFVAVSLYVCKQWVSALSASRKNDCSGAPGAQIKDQTALVRHSETSVLSRHLWKSLEPSESLQDTEFIHSRSALQDNECLLERAGIRSLHPTRI